MESKAGPQPLSRLLPAAPGRQSEEGKSSREPPSDAELKVVEYLFKRFVAHYGSVRMAAHWNGQEPEFVQGYWARKCAGLSPRSVEYGLGHLPQHPPTVDEFRAICNRCPPPRVLCLDLKRSPEQIEHGAKQIESIRRRFPGFFRKDSDEIGDV